MDDEYTRLGKLSVDDEPDWVVGTISKRVPQRMERAWHQQTIIDQLTQPGWCHTAGYCRERDEVYDTMKSKLLEVVILQMDEVADAPRLTTAGEQMESHDIIPGKSEIPQVTS